MWCFLLLLQNMPEPAIWHSGSNLTHARHHLGEFIIFRGRTATLLPFLRSISNFCTLKTISFPPSSAVYCWTRHLIHRHSQEWSNAKCLRSLMWEILLIIHSCMKNLAFHSSLQWKIIISTNNSQYLNYMPFFWKVVRMYVFELRNEKVKQHMDSSQRRFS